MLLLVIGHSFVLWLEESPGDELRATVSVTFRDVMMKGIGRLTVDHMAVMLPIVKTLSPSVVLLIVGTYDLSPLVIIPERCIGGAMYRWIEYPSDIGKREIVHATINCVSAYNNSH